jgi:prepilin-type N-terminal cleavage/methylation domain-containing protein
MTNKKAFTLAEIIVAVAIFSMIISVFLGFISSSIKNQQRILSLQELLANVSYDLEYMSRAIRMAKKDHDGACLTSSGEKYNYETNATRDRIRFLNYDDKCQEFFLEDGILKERKSTDDTATNFATALPLTPSSLDITSFIIGRSDSWGQSQLTQPKVTFSLHVEKDSDEIPISIDIQTTTSQRNLNRIY